MQWIPIYKNKNIEITLHKKNENNGIIADVLYFIFEKRINIYNISNLGHPKRR